MNMWHLAFATTAQWHTVVADKLNIWLEELQQQLEMKFLFNYHKKAKSSRQDND
jgi:hypothetical protein